MEMVRKVLAPFHIFVPATNFLDGDSGHEVFEINQFGDKMGMSNNGEVVVKTGSNFFVYFEYAMNDTGSFDIFCEIVNEDELDEIMADIEAEMEEGDDDYYDEMEDAEDSFDEYKSDNQLKEEVDSIVNDLLNENSIKDFVPPFSASGLWVSDKRGNNVLEVTRHGNLAKEVAKALNSHFGKLNEEKSDDDRSSADIKRIKAKYALKDAEKTGHKKSQAWLNKMVKRKNIKP